VISTRRSALPAVRAAVLSALALATLPLVGCSATTSGSVSSSSGTPSTTTSVPAPSATGSVVTPSVDTQRLTAIATCLKNADLPTPTSTDPGDAASELVALLRDPRTIAALRSCGVSLPPGVASASS
jgi:hypothetical protein